MNSKERREARYQRRRAEREKKKQAYSKPFDDYENVFTFEHLYDAYKKCCDGVGWKASTQRYKVEALIRLAATYDDLMAGKFKSRGFYEFDIVERGKERHIQSVHISERVVQRCLCDYSLVPLFKRPLIYDNGACLENKGVDFSIRRLKCHLSRYYRKYGTEGYALVFDFSKYFDNISHDRLKQIVAKCYTDKRLIGLIGRLIDDFGGDAGIGLGSQISQVSAVMYPNALDHYIKEQLGIKFYGRYMDDGYLLHPDKEYLKKCLEAITRICAEMGVKMNIKKTQIVKLSRGITFLKRRFVLTETGRVLVLPARKAITKKRRMLKKFRVLLDEGRMKFIDILLWRLSWEGYFKHCNGNRSERSLLYLFNRLFKKELKAMKYSEITIENICQACEKGPCDEPCELWYECLEGRTIKVEDLQ